MQAAATAIVRIGLVGLLAVASASRAVGDGPPGKDKTRHANRLAKETSPYLLLHAHNPVDWYPWGAGGVCQGQGREQADLSLGRL